MPDKKKEKKETAMQKFSRQIREHKKHETAKSIFSTLKGGPDFLPEVPDSLPPSVPFPASTLRPPSLLMRAMAGGKKLNEQLMEAVTKDDGTELVDRLYHNGASIDSQDNDGYTPLSMAIVATTVRPPGVRPDLVKFMLEANADVNIANKNGETPLSYASAYGYADIVKMLLRVGADVNTKGVRNKTPLIHASQNGHAAIIPLLLGEGADFFAMDVNGMTAISWAAANGNTAVVEEFQKARLDVNLREPNCTTPLMRAVANGHMGTVNYLVRLGANIHAKEFDTGSNALMISIRRGYPEIANLLLDAGAEINPCDADGRTALMHAIQYGQAAIVKKLLGMDVNVHAHDKDGHSALSLAKASGNGEMAALFTSLPDLSGAYA